MKRPKLDMIDRQLIIQDSVTGALLNFNLKFKILLRDIRRRIKSIL